MAAHLERRTVRAFRAAVSALPHAAFLDIIDSQYFDRQVACRSLLAHFIADTRPQ